MLSWGRLSSLLGFLLYLWCWSLKPTEKAPRKGGPGAGTPRGWTEVASEIDGMGIPQKPKALLSWRKPHASSPGAGEAEGEWSGGGWNSFGLATVSCREVHGPSADCWATGWLPLPLCPPNLPRIFLWSTLARTYRKVDSGNLALLCWHIRNPHTIGWLGELVGP